MTYTKITIDTTVLAVDMISYQLGELGVEGIEVEDKLPLTEEEKQAMYIDIVPEQKEHYDGYAKISCYIPMGKEEPEGIRNTGIAVFPTPVFHIPKLLSDIRGMLDKLSTFMDVGPKTITVDSIDDKDWLYKWKEYFKPFRLEQNIIIKPSWEEVVSTDPEDIVLEIDPGIAFGTGTHDTTKLSIRQLKKYISKFAAYRPTTVLDVGCGSGILSMIAIKLGAAKVVGTDIDEIAVKVSKENAEKNHILPKQLHLRQGDLIGDDAFAASIGEQFDIVVANILADVIIPLSRVIGSFMKPDGIFISSGIINTKEEEVRHALTEQGFEVIETTYMGEWVSFTAAKKG